MSEIEIIYNTTLPVGDDIKSGKPCSIIRFDPKTYEVTHEEHHNLENIKLTDYALESLARAFLPAIQEFYMTEEGQQVKKRLDQERDEEEARKMEKEKNKKMSYDIRLNDPVTKQTIQVDEPHLMRGGTYAVGGTKELWLNITYNYSCVFCRTDIFGQEGIRSIYGKTGAETIPIFKNAIDKLADDVDDDYWKPTEGNVKKSLNALLTMAQMRPDGVWDGD